MVDAGTPIAYSALDKGVDVVSVSGRKFGTVEHVLQVPEEDLFDGIVVHTHHGLRFIDRDQVKTITTAAVTCTFSDDAVDDLPKPHGTATFEPAPGLNPLQVLNYQYGYLFARSRWKRSD